MHIKYQDTQLCDSSQERHKAYSVLFISNQFQFLVSLNYLTDFYHIYVFYVLHVHDLTYGTNITAHVQVYK